MAKNKLTKSERREARDEQSRKRRSMRRRAGEEPLTFLQAFRVGLFLFALLVIPLAIAVTYLSPLYTYLGVDKALGLLYGFGLGLLAAAMLAALFALRAVRTDADSREATGG